MFGIKNLFHQYNQELMEFMGPSPMMGMGYSPMMGIKPGSKPFNPWDPNNKDKEKDKDKKDNFWKVLLALGATAGLGGLGVYGYSQYNKANSLKSQAGKAVGKYLDVNFNDLVGSGTNILNHQMQKNAIVSQEKSNADGLFSSIGSALKNKFGSNANNTPPNNNNTNTNNNT